MNGDEPSRVAPLKAKFQIGSAQAPINYKFQESCFHVDDIPPQKLAAKREIQKALASQILAIDKHAWDASTADTMLKTPSHKRTFVHAEMNHGNMYQYNFRAEKLPDKYPTLLSKPNKFNTGILEVAQKDVYRGEAFGDERMMRGICKRTEELPNHPNLVDAERWNHSTQFSKQELRHKFKEKEAARIANSERAMAATAKAHKSVIALYEEQKRQLREQKAATLASTRK
ncbi:hypothetical protein SPRG_05045 [Saprolegnia parasitica CBS 223.65]|uniref:Uncharacterized protein n=1 Tax=Saprolegnia parasitica (strain CBS 223.65) TaxID=695850 RepID=A0A067CHX2_SAPPC|nr:hypothetical protein SPRG_05045 [Saprolegnia parasitica CBS 223.65]KDO30334.1 hypothetical protein SPRG_05045 [Saprolegnia parasitica CBS 223.65]|eukprot:XP_012198944.1 hypothetical protein SPRG_05045 [Saprolegnia parasitica CBS 223.65]